MVQPTCISHYAIPSTHGERSRGRIPRSTYWDTPHHYHLISETPKPCTLITFATPKSQSVTHTRSAGESTYSKSYPIWRVLR